MKAVRIHSFGSTDVMHIEEVETPRPERGEVLIRVVAASVNPVDYEMRSGEFKLPGAQMPLILGRDVSGVVEAVGRGVSAVDVGDEVIALLDRDHGGYAEFVVARSDAVAPKPATIDHVHAAAIPLAAITAWQGLFDHGDLRRGQRVLIHGASGGVGHFAVQFAKNRGAFVIATARGEDADFLTSLGADEAIDYRNERFEERVKDVDLVLDLVAGEDFMALPDRRELEEISRMIDDGKVEVIVQETMPLAEARHAHEVLEKEHVRGKLVLEVAEA